MSSYGYAAARAFSTYRDRAFLDAAQRTWSIAQLYTVSELGVSVGRVSTKGTEFNKGCFESSWAGATFMGDQTTNVQDTYISGQTTGSFILLSALLAETTSSKVYSDAALLSIQFVHNKLYKDNVMSSDAPSATSKLCNLRVFEGPAGTGLLIESLAILGTTRPNTSLTDMLENTVLAALQKPEWQGADGISSWGGKKDGNQYIVRGLAAAYSRNASTEAFRNYIKDYLSVQYNALMNQATYNGTDVYGESWIGPPLAGLSGSGQTGAVTALIGGLRIFNNESVTRDSPQGTPQSAPALGSNIPVRSIIGGVIGGVVLLIIVCTAFFKLFRHRGREKQNANITIPEPYTIESLSVRDTIPRKFRRIISEETVASADPGMHEDRIIPGLGNKISNAELYRLPSEWLQSSRWNETDPPPAYPQSAAGSHF
ncbi:hypothetical protein VNI00_018876 [Paramarasmius palmivorus]|uniref:Glycoside hydrolase family 76 protein n=1 Tax=Paramarasmius palmivorus TaxID=297713 RepID=A0AAW0ATK5_9AGAR